LAALRQVEGPWEGNHTVNLFPRIRLDVHPDPSSVAAPRPVCCSCCSSTCPKAPTSQGSFWEGNHTVSLFPRIRLDVHPDPSSVAAPRPVCCSCCSSTCPKAPLHLCELLGQLVNLRANLLLCPRQTLRHIHVMPAVTCPIPAASLSPPIWCHVLPYTETRLPPPL